MNINFIEKNDELELFQIKIPQDTEPIRVDKFLSSYSGYTRSRISNYLYKLYINKKEEKLSKIIKPDDHVEIYLKVPEDYTEIKPQFYDLEVIYEDKFILIVKKPFGIPTHPSFGHPSNTMLNFIKFYIENKGEKPLLDCGMVHRLDKDTEGILIFAKTIESQNYLKSLFANRNIVKKYFAIINGSISPSENEFKDKLSRDLNDRLKFTVSLKGKEAILTYKCVGKSENYSAVEIDLKTGRTHQIRVQFSHRGYFIIGDPIYGKKQLKNYENYGMLLLSKKISFFHPQVDKYLEFEINLPERFNKFIKENSIIVEG